tara:strand:+ start:39022 stop:39477 length:456 start_codon:yes stop_codon:yes gene_type:complete
MNYLFDNKYKKISGLVFYLTSIIGLYLLITEIIFALFTLKVYSLFSESFSDLTYGGGWIENGLGDEIFTTIIIVSGLINSFCKEKIKDELISKIRLESLTMSLFITYGLVIISTFLIYNLSYMYVLVFNLFIILILFNLIFRYRLYKHYKS